MKLFDLSVMGYVETLFGHQDFVMSIDALQGETAVTCGGRDRTVRYWKIVDETQLVFRGGGRSKLRDLLEGGAFEGMDVDEGGKPREKEQKTYIEGSMEVVCMVDEITFLSGGDSGYAFFVRILHLPSPLTHPRSISLWSTQKKKPVYVQALAHGLHETVSEERGSITSPRWITAIGSLRYSDLFASGKRITACVRPFSLRSRFVGWPGQVMETGPKIEIIFIGWVCERSRCHQFDPASVSAEGYYLLVGRDEQKFRVTCRWGRTRDEDGAVDCRQGFR